MHWCFETTIEPRIMVLGLVLIVSLVGCDDDGEATFLATFMDPASTCYSGQFPFEPTFFSALGTPTGVVMRMEAEDREKTRTDGFYLVFDNTVTGITDPNTGQVVTCPETLEGAMDVPVGPNLCIQAYFRFNETCLRDFLNPHIVGTVSFTRFGVDEDDRIEGSIDGQLVDLKVVRQPGADQEVQTPIGTVNGTFRFKVVDNPARLIYTIPPRLPAFI